MNGEMSVQEKINRYIVSEFGTDYRIRVRLIQKIESPCRFNVPIFLAVIQLNLPDEDVIKAIANSDPDDIAHIRKNLEEGHEFACVFDSEGRELERHIKGMDYFFDYEKIQL